MQSSVCVFSEFSGSCSCLRRHATPCAPRGAFIFILIHPQIAERARARASAGSLWCLMRHCPCHALRPMSNVDLELILSAPRPCS
eukprot:scaffold10866_cov124-Isochrysis_galbana.AAC.1